MKVMGHIKNVRIFLEGGAFKTDEVSVITDITKEALCLRRLGICLKKNLKGEEGTVAVLMAFLLVILLGFTALAVDYGVVYLRRSQLQTAVDTAARAASRILVDDTMDDQEKQQKINYAVMDYLNKNGFPRDKLDKCDIDIDAEKGVSIDASSKVELNFAKIFTDKPIPIAASATAVTDFTETAGKKVTVDVVFVLDISGSMYYSNGSYKANAKLIPMINAVNSAANSILNENSRNRVSIVVFSSSDYTKSILNLTSCPCTVSSVSVSGTNYSYQCSSAYAPRVFMGYNIRVHKDYRGREDGRTIIVGGNDGFVEQTLGGTFTQMGICKGAQLLMDSYNDGIQRVPAVFIMSDGESTYANQNYSMDISQSNLGNGTTSYNSRNENQGFSAKIGYYTILTANYWKQKLSELYTERNGQETTARFYSLGFNLSDTEYPDYAAGVLNPDTLNSAISSTYAMKLKTMLEGSSNPYLNNYLYADKYYEATGAEQLKEVLKDFACDVVLPTKTYTTRLTR